MTAASVTAFCPGHISGYFRRVDGSDAATTGSVGAGIVISEGVTSTVKRAAQTSVVVRILSPEGIVRDLSFESPPLMYALDRLGVTVAVETLCRLPISAGFGLSAAALLSTLTATDHLLEIGLGADGIAERAHETEVLFRTGLGDVAACQGGGRVVRTGPGIHGRIHRSFDLDAPVCAVSFGPIHTPEVLGSPARMAQVAAAFPERQPTTVTEFFTCCREFSLASGLETPSVQRVLLACDREGVPAAMTMLGDGVFAYGDCAGVVLRSFGELYTMGMAKGGVRIMEEVA
ncbi:pantoate kinase [Methanoregula sp.]|uniref:pantoate kinase n=1 Tax=Methanoregula sp. TaxID=2052170 RepID=UPI002B5A5C19|nr:pantoate kinase [Methanoregula sp.]HVP97381.1 pantoate kinase [Methanoregula sp.]